MAIVLTIDEQTSPQELEVMTIILHNLVTLRRVSQPAPLSEPMGYDAIPAEGSNVFTPPTLVPRHDPVMPEVREAMVVVPAPITIPEGVELDVEGLPWDQRIHGSTKAKNADGTWRRKRNTPDADYEAIKAQLKQAMCAPVPRVEELRAQVAELELIPPPPIAVVPPPPAAIVEGGSEAVPLAPVPPNAPAATANEAGAAVAASNPMAAFTTLLKRITEDQAAGRLSAEQVTATLQAMGLTSPRDLLARPDMVEPFELALYA